MSDYKPRSPLASKEASHSRLSTWQTCRMMWFNQYWRAHPESAEARGWRPKILPATLTVGSAYHVGLEEYRRSQIRDGEDTGEANLERAVAKIEATFSAFEAEGAFEDEPARRVQELNKTVDMLRRYNAHFGKDGVSPLWPDLKIATDDNGEPYIEREFVHELGDGWSYICKPDAIGYYQGRLVAIEDKTCSASTLRRTLESVHMGAQFIGEAWTIGQTKLLGEDTPAVLLLAHVKNPGKSASSLRFAMDIVDWSEAEIEIWRRNTVKLTQEIDQHLLAYEQLVADGMHPDVAALTVFPRTGTLVGACTMHYGRDCDYLPMCRMPGKESRYAGAYRPRMKEEG